MRNSQVRSEIAKLKEKGVPFPLRATLARKRYELRGYCSQKFTFLREEGGCGDTCCCGADSVYGGTLKVKRKRNSHSSGKWVQTPEVKVKERKFELTLNEMGMVESFGWI